MPGTPPNCAPESGRLLSLTGLRFVAALVVFGFHLHVQGLFVTSDARGLMELVFKQGATGVSFFFVLSGFVLTWSARPGDTAAAIWRRRMAKIVPNHIVTWLVAIGGVSYLSTHTVSFASAVPGLVLVQAWVPVEQVFFGVNTPAWSLSCEVAFYAAFPLLLTIIRKPSEDHLWLLAGGLVLLIALVPVLAFPFSPTVAYWLVYICPATRGLEFVLGMVLARIVHSGSRIKVGLWPASGFLVVCYAASAFLPWRFSFVAGTIIPICLLIYCAAVSDITGSFSPWRSRICVWLGEISFAFYMVHHLVIRGVAKIFGSPDMSVLRQLGLSAVMFVVTLVAAAVLYRTVERPMMRVLAPRRRPGTAEERSSGMVN